MANTTNLNLVKPAGTDHALISDINGNMDIIDAAIGALPSGSNLQGEINSLNDSITGFTNIVSLWTNTDTTQSFAGQNIAVDLTDYCAIIVCFRYNTSATLYNQHIFPNKNRSVAMSMNTGGTVKFMSRSVEWDSAKVKFGDGKSFAMSATTDSTDNTCMIPAVIYGVKKDIVTT